MFLVRYTIENAYGVVKNRRGKDYEKEIGEMLSIESYGTGAVARSVVSDARALSAAAGVEFCSDRGRTTGGDRALSVTYGRELCGVNIKDEDMCRENMLGFMIRKAFQEPAPSIQIKGQDGEVIRLG